MQYRYRSTFRGVHEQYQHLDGQPFEVVSVIQEPTPEVDEESLPMFLVNVAGEMETISAWPEEVLDYDCYTESYEDAEARRREESYANER